MQADASLVLLTYEGERSLPQGLAMIARQEVRPAQIIAIDSGSSDATVDILRRSPIPIELHRIDKDEFSHSRTRNQAARLARSRHLVFLTQDATPADGAWLARLLQPFQDFSRVAGVFSRQLARPGGDLLEANDLHVSFTSMRQVRTFPREPPYFREHIWDYIQFSNSSSAYDRDLLVQHPFDERLAMAEDQEWAKRMLEKGFAIVYEPESLVLHSHDLTLRQKWRRFFEFGVAFAQFLARDLGPRPLPWRQWLYQMLLDAVYLARSPAPLRERIRWLCRSPVHRAATYYAYYRGWNSAAHAIATQSRCAP
jgi:rhamnosyltransferase